MGTRHRESGGVKSCDHPVLALDRMRRRQQLPGRLAAQHIFLSVGSRQAVGGIRLSALELLDGADAEAEEFLERALIDAMPLVDRLRADELLEHGVGSLT